MTPRKKATQKKATKKKATQKKAARTKSNKPRNGNSKYTDQKAVKICEAVRSGSSLVEAAKRVNVNVLTAYRWMDAEPNFRNDYARAREERGEHYGRKVSELAEQTELGHIDPQAARVAMDGYKWTAARMAPKQWGDRKEVNLGGQSDNPVKLESSGELTGLSDAALAQMRKILESESGDGKED